MESRQAGDGGSFPRDAQVIGKMKSRLSFNAIFVSNQLDFPFRASRRFGHASDGEGKGSRLFFVITEGG